MEPPMNRALTAVTRQVSPSIGRCELTHLVREPIDAARAAEQHRRYEQCLAELGVRVVSLPAEPDLPDSVFVEDAAVVLDEIAVITRPGAPSRRPETRSVAEALRPYRELRFMEGPGCIDGGDVLRIGKTLHVGLSGRSDTEGVAELKRLVEPSGYTVSGKKVAGCLHLKSAATLVAPDTLLANGGWVNVRDFAGMRIIEIDPAEPYAANALCVAGAVIYPAAFAATRERLEREGIRVVTVDASEFAKAEGAVTCCSLVFEA
jgi:dimethylargininase